MKKYKINRRFTRTGGYLQGARQASGLTQTDVSQRLGYSSAQFMSNFERGISMPPLEKLRDLVKIYSLEIALLLENVMADKREELLAALKGKK